MQSTTVWDGDTVFGRYQVVDCWYDGRPARVLYSGDRQAAQSGVATDGKPELLFDYNQRFMELALAQRPRTVAIIGGGTGTFATALLAALPEVRVDMVEPNANLTDLGYEFFDLPVDERLQIFHTDGRTFLREHAARYDLVVVDAFSHTTMPKDLATAAAARAYRRHLTVHGLLAMNVISGYNGLGAVPLAQLGSLLGTVFEQVEVFVARRGYSLWLPQNFVVIAHAGNDDIAPADYLHTDVVSMPAM